MTIMAEIVNQVFDYLIVMDFEATCDEKKVVPQEIIEWPAIILDTLTLQPVSEFHSYIKPIAHPILTPFCINLTGIQQEWVDKSSTFPVVHQRFNQWFDEQNYLGNSYAFVTCGDWDLKTALTNQLKYSGLKRRSIFNQWINIKESFKTFYGLKTSGMEHMLQFLSIELKGRHHSGIDDTRNITEITKRLIQDGHSFTVTSYI